VRRLAIFLILVPVIYFTAGLIVSETTRIVILPGKTYGGWRVEDVDFLISILEEKATELGRFEVYSRQNLKEILKERNLADLGITEADAIEIGKIASARYAILLTLNDLETGCRRSNQCWASARLSVKLIDITDGKTIGTKAISVKTFKVYETTDDAKDALFELIGVEFLKVMREFFTIEAFVWDVRPDGIAVLRGIDPRIVKKGFIFKVEDDYGNEGYVKVFRMTKEGVLARILYGKVQKGMKATEFVTAGIEGDIHLTYMPTPISPLFGIGVSTWKEGFMVSIDYIAGTIEGYTPFLANIGLKLEPFHMDRGFLELFGGASLIGLYDENEGYIADAIFGAFVGGGIRYEFNPVSGVRINYQKDFFFGFETSGTVRIGYFIGF